MGGGRQNVPVHFNVCKPSRFQNWKKIKKDVQNQKSLIFFRVRRQNVILHFDVFARVFYNRGSKCTITFLRWDHVDDVKK